MTSRTEFGVFTTDLDSSENYGNCDNSLSENFVLYGQATIDNRPAFVVTWYKIRHFGDDSIDKVGTFQIILESTDNNQYIVQRNYESIHQSSYQNYGRWGEAFVYGPDVDWLSNSAAQSISALVDGGTNSLAGNSSNSEISGRYEKSISPVSITYDSNNSDSGNAPVDNSSPYAPGSSVSVLGNSGNLVKSGFIFKGWNTARNGFGTSYSPGDNITLNSDVTLFARWLAPYEINIYMDAPYVQASYVSALSRVSSATEDFDHFSPQPSNGASCPTSLSVGVIAPGSDCKFWSIDPYFGGATTTDPTKKVAGGVHSNYVSSQSSAGTTFEFTDPNTTYIGFWWSAGSFGNTVTFYSGTTPLANFNADQLYSLLGHGGSLKSLSGNNNYPTDNYWGHPANPALYDSGEPFVYVHVLAQPGTSFSSMKISTTGNGFEMDNLTTSSSTGISPDPSLVPVATLNSDGSQSNINQLRFDSQGGDPVDSISYHSGDVLTSGPSDPKKQNFIFQGWYSAPTGGVQISFSGAGYSPPSVSTTLYAQWSTGGSPTTYTVHFDKQGHGTAPADATGVTSIALADLPTEATDGYFTFSGWSTTSSGAVLTGSYTPVADATLYAIWSDGTPPPPPPPVSGSLSWSIGGKSTKIFSTRNTLTLTRTFSLDIDVSDQGRAFLLQAPLDKSGICGTFTSTNYFTSSTSLTLNISDGVSPTSSSNLVRGSCYQWTQDTSTVESALPPIATQTIDTTTVDVQFTQESLTSNILALPKAISTHWPSTLPVDPRASYVDLPIVAPPTGASQIHFCVMAGTESDWSNRPGSKLGDLTGIGTINSSSTTLTFSLISSGLARTSDSTFSINVSEANFAESVTKVRITTTATNRFADLSYILIRTVPSFVSSYGIESSCTGGKDADIVQPLPGEAAVIQILPYDLKQTIRRAPISQSKRR